MVCSVLVIASKLLYDLGQHLKGVNDGGWAVPWLYRFVGPTDLLQPHGVATEGGRRVDVLAVLVANDNYLLWLQAKCLCPQCEQCRVGFAQAYNRRFHNLLEIAVEPELLKHHRHVAVEIGHQYHGVVCR